MKKSRLLELETGKKCCSKCKQTKSLDEFYKANGNGLRGDCKLCNNKKVKKYTSTHRSHCNETAAKWRQQNPEKVKAIGKRFYQKNKARRHQENWSNPYWRVVRSCRRRIYQALNGNPKSDNSMNLIGCTPNELRAHLERQFTAGMTWDNYGVKGWHIDHRKPCASFDLTLPEQQKICFHYTNLQPLWAKDNLSKGSSI